MGEHNRIEMRKNDKTHAEHFHPFNIFPHVEKSTAAACPLVVLLLCSVSVAVPSIKGEEMEGARSVSYVRA